MPICTQPKHEFTNQMTILPSTKGCDSRLYNCIQVYGCDIHQRIGHLYAILNIITITYMNKLLFVALQTARHKLAVLQDEIKWLTGI